MKLKFISTEIKDTKEYNPKLYLQSENSTYLIPVKITMKQFYNILAKSNPTKKTNTKIQVNYYNY